jgi:transposase
VEVFSDVADVRQQLLAEQVERFHQRVGTFRTRGLQQRVSELSVPGRRIGGDNCDNGGYTWRLLPWPRWALGRVPKLLVPDNTKVVVIKACLYEPQVNRTYAEMAAHYETAILPARPRRPRDKAKVEVAVLIIERWLLGRLRHHRFYSLAELNAAIGELLRQLNDERPIRRLGVTRRALFEEIDRPNLNALPAEPYSFAEWRLRRVGVDYHVELEGHFYSVPYRFARSEVEVRLTPRAVEIFLKGERIAAHLRASGNHRHTAVPGHMLGFRFEPAHRNALRLAAWPRNETCCAGPVTPSSTRGDPTLPVAHLPPNRSR